MSFLVPVLEIGGSGGFPFDFRGTDSGATVEKIGVWAGEWQIRCVKIWLTNGQSREFGKADEHYSEFIFKSGELITSVSLWDNTRSGTKVRLGAIKFQTSLDRTFFSKMYGMSLGQEKPVDIGSGICMGVVGRAGLDLDRLGFLFINPIQSSVLTNISYPTIFEILPQVVVEELKSVTYRNDTTFQQEFTLESTKTVNKTSSWSVTNKIEATFSMTVKAGIPEVAEFESGYSFTVGTESSYSLQYSEEKEEKVSVPIKVPPGRAVDGKITIGRANVDLPYKGTVKITCYNGSTLEFNISGVYSGITYTSANVHVTEHNIQLK